MLREILKIIKRHLVQPNFKRVQFQYNCRPSKVAKNWSKNVMLNCNFSHNLKGFQSKRNIIAHNISGTVFFIVFFNQAGKFSMTIHCFQKSFQEYFCANESLHFKYYNKIFACYFKKKMKVGFLNPFKTNYRMLLTFLNIIIQNEKQEQFIRKMSGIDPSVSKKKKKQTVKNKTFIK